MAIKRGDLHEVDYSEEYGKSYVKYVAEIKHTGLGTYRILKDKDEYFLENKIDAQFNKWDEQWNKVVQKNNLQLKKEAHQNAIEERINNAKERNDEAKEKLKEIEDILLKTLTKDDRINWESLKDKKPFTVKNPKHLLDNEIQNVLVPSLKEFRTLPIKPSIVSFKPKLNIIDGIFRSRKEKKIKEAEVLYQKALESYEKDVNNIEFYNEQVRKEHEQVSKDIEIQKRKIAAKYDELEKEWLKQKDEFYAKQKEYNLKIDKFIEQYLKKDSEAVMQYCEMVLNNSEYPEFISKNFDLDYNLESKLLIVEYSLPAPENFPKVSEVKYIATKKEIKEYFLTENQINKIYDTAIYNICLRTIHELFEADTANALDLVVFNGWVTAINKANGKKVTANFNALLGLSDSFQKLIDKFENLPQEDKILFMSFIEGFTSFINSSTKSYTSLAEFHKLFSNRATRLIDEYQIAATR